MFTIAIDFDGTIVDDNFPFDETIKEYAKEVINKYYDIGCYISIWTCRCGWFVTDCERILNDNGIKFHAINHGNPIYSHGRKIYADCYIDDKSIPYFNWYKANEVIQYYKNRYFGSDWVTNKEELYDLYYSECKKRCPANELFYMEESLKKMLKIIEKEG